MQWTVLLSEVLHKVAVNEDKQGTSKLDKQAESSTNVCFSSLKQAEIWNMSVSTFPKLNRS